MSHISIPGGVTLAQIAAGSKYVGFPALATLVAALDANVQMIWGPSFHSQFTAPAAGSVVGLVREQMAPGITAGTLTLEVFVAGVLSQSVAVTTGTTGYHALATAATFTAGQIVDLRYSTNALYAGATDLAVVPIYTFDF